MVKTKMQVYLRKDPKLNWLFQFSFNGKKYYEINDRNVVRLPPYDPLRQKLNRVIQGKTETFEGHYDKNVKALAIIAEAF